MGKDTDDERGILDGGEDLQSAVTVLIVPDIDVEDALEEAHPTDPARGNVAEFRSAISMHAAPVNGLRCANSD